ncbi:DeoR/GlpR family DNA-binding transcription regulator [Mucilaginibacter sp. PAMB04274]|uniref:DeoR/GlpR family DNA-binding transcription regulator n=1 Tax=Mucilaginibacter sp. PAMB04274 TaxID=3138568 RepID=UPI0031F6C7ED
MAKLERQQHIIEQLRLNDQVNYQELAVKLNTSEDTVRRDIRELADAGLITRVKGGAQPKAILPVTYQEREVYAHAEKCAIARKTAKLFKEGQIVVLDGGTTPFLIVSYLPRDIRLTIITHSYPIANLTFDFPNVDLIFAGGKASKKSKVSTGVDVLKKYETLNADISVLGVHSLHLDHGITDPILEEADVKTRISEMSDQLIVVPTAEKLNSISTVQICKIEAIDLMVTDLEPDDILLQSFQNAGIKLI